MAALQALRAGVGMPLLLLALLGAVSVTCTRIDSAGITSGAEAAPQRVLGREAMHVLFSGDHGARRLQQQPHSDSAIAYETLRVVGHPLRADMSQKKVQQIHGGLPLFGHSFVIGLAADGVTEQAEGTFGTVFTGLDQAIPNTTPVLTTADALEVAASATSGVALTSKLVVWVEKEDSNVAHNAHLAYLVTLSVTPGAGMGTYALVDAMSGVVLRTWSHTTTQHAPRPRPRQDTGHDSGDADTQVTETPETASVDPQPFASTSSHSVHAAATPQRSLKQAAGKIVNVWGIGGNEKVGRIYYNGSNGTPQLQVTKAGRNCSFVSKYVKTGDLSRVYTPVQLKPGSAAFTFTKLADSAWNTFNFPLVKGLYNFIPAVTYPCPTSRQYIRTTDSIHGAYSQQADVHAIMSRVFLMWKNWLKVDLSKEFAAAGVPIPLLILPHADPAWDNAAWLTWYFICGDGILEFPMCTAGDILAHELGHGVTRIVNGDLLYYGQPGAWNEGFSDMVGLTYNFYSTGRVDSLIGTAVMRTAPCLRNMSNPALYNQVASALDLTTNDPHTLSGPPNRAFYRLATSPCYDPKVAMLVVQRAAHLYFTPTASFLEGANAWVRAARDLGYSTAPVRNAWESVGLWEACGAHGRGFEDAFHNPDPPLPADDKFYNGKANITQLIGNISYDDMWDVAETYMKRQPCGLSFSMALYSSIISPSLQRTNMYVGINRMPDPTAGIWDCSVDTSSGPGPALPSCNVQVIENATYFVVARGSERWVAQTFTWRLWGPTVGDDTSATVLPGPGDPASALKCFTGGTCTSDSGCSSGSCTQGYCAAKAGRHRTAARKALAEP